MTAEEKKMRDFLRAEMNNREFTLEQLDRVAAVLYPHDGSDESVRRASRQFGNDMIKWAKEVNDEQERKHPKPMTEDEIVALAAIM
ncbi:MAG: hypothetical protein IJM04_07230 [Prevotella sp.]|nr:hypothetical protein [Prevotella sp.]